MNFEVQEENLEKLELYKKLQEGLEDLQNGRARPYEEFREEIFIKYKN
ncbi:MAG: hypothetical protein J6K87_01945 [Clostridia bacterium]|nr:hypothetical protein [Clostridia bacterium]